jgi:hypothetical protein
MADLSQIDLDGDSEPTPVTSVPGEDFVIDEAYDEDDSRHVKTEDLHLYYRQSLRSRIGDVGVVVIATFAIMLVMVTAILFFSYLPPGRRFLQGLIFYLF